MKVVSFCFVSSGAVVSSSPTRSVMDVPKSEQEVKKNVNDRKRHITEYAFFFDIIVLLILLLTLILALCFFNCGKRVTKLVFGVSEDFRYIVNGSGSHSCRLGF